MQKFVISIACLMMILIGTSESRSEMISLDETLDRLIKETSRGKIHFGERQVSRARFDAEKIGYYIPGISFNTTLPSYNSSEDYANYPGFQEPLLIERTDIASTGNIQFRQKIITGGDLTFRAAFDLQNREFPISQIITTPEVDSMGDITYVSHSEISVSTDKRRMGQFVLSFNQPLFQTSDSRVAYLNARDQLGKAEIEWRRNMVELKKEGIAVYFDLLSAVSNSKMADKNSQLADYNAYWDSVKFEDGVLSEVAWIESKSERLEKRLSLFDAEASHQEKLNEFNHLLDFPADNDPVLLIPEAAGPPGENLVRQYLANAEKTTETELARMNMEISERELDVSRNAFGLNGQLNASYALGRGTVKRGSQSEEKISTKDWRVSLDFSYPIWDGGASGASIHSQELAYEAHRLEYLSAQRKSKNAMSILLKRVDINHSKLSLLTQELELAERKLTDTEKRFTDGMVSKGILLENQVYYLETKKSFLTTIKEYYSDMAELEKTDLR